MSELTQDQKRIRIAEACGWTNVRIVPVEGHGYMTERIIGLHPEQLNPDNDEWVPDYFGSLDAMHDAEKAICDRLSYYIELEREMNTADSTLVVSATAAQRAEAFGRALNLW